MAHAMQAPCPGCKKVLRFPADRSKQTFRCPSCGTVIRLKENCFTASIHRPPAFRRRSRGFRWGLFLALMLLAVAVAAIYLEATNSIQPSLSPPHPPAVKQPRAGSQPTDIIFPRRILAIAVNDYLYANPVGDGSPDGDLHTLVQRLARVLHVAPSQVIEAGGMPPWKWVIEQTVKKFLDTSRPQDRILVFFVGHVSEIGGEAFLVPLEGDLGVKETLIPLNWLYEQLAKCRARQKVLILDSCRLDPSRGLVRPGSGPMTASLDRLLQKPPAGVQLWSACTSGQYSYESGGRGVFLDKLSDALTDSVLKKAPEPEDPLPIDTLAKVVDRSTAAEAAAQIAPLDGQKAVQTPRLTGQLAEPGAVYAQDEPLPRPPEIHAPSLPGGVMAKPDQIESILREIELPPIKAAHSQRTLVQIVAKLPFAAEVIERYRPDYGSLAEIEKHPQKYPLRIEVIKTIKLLRATFDPQGPQGSLLEYFQGGSGERLKAAIFKQQMKPARILAELTERLEELGKAGEQRDKEPSRRWQAHYDYILAQLLARTAYVSEYDLMLGKIRKDELPELQSTRQTGWRLASCEKLASGKDVRAMAAQAKKLFAKLSQEQPGTPWQVLAKRGMLTALGMEWRPSY
jgi:predicted RNA-binding Zn-ribbon protein involved in translation (DUF1610 family)